MNIKDLTHFKFYEYFRLISSIPRCSDHEKKLSDALVDFAKGLDLEVYQDSSYNLIIKKPGQGQNASSDSVILQAHIDMVCEKNCDVSHDFEVDAIELIIEDNVLKANKTTLGADNGIGVAYAMSILSDKSISHPPLEVVFTTNEETGMNGALELDASTLKSKQMINMDSETEGVLLASCAGGLTTKTVIKPELVNSADFIKYDLSITGLSGGHSGVDIHLQKANAISVLGRILNELRIEFPIRIKNIRGGSKDNAIPREAFCELYFESANEDRFKTVFTKLTKALLHEYTKTDSKMEIVFEKRSNAIEQVYSEKSTNEIIAMICLIPQGVLAMSQSIDNLVETSNNLGVLTSTTLSVEFTCAIRSSISSHKTMVKNQVKLLSDLVNAEFIASDEYPAWEYKEDSLLRTIFANSYQKLYSKEIKIEAIHAGLECGILAEKIVDVDIVSFGPNIYNPHTPDEYTEIDSLDRCYELLLDVLENL